MSAAETLVTEKERATSAHRGTEARSRKKKNVVLSIGPKKCIRRKVTDFLRCPIFRLFSSAPLCLCVRTVQFAAFVFAFALAPPGFGKSGAMFFAFHSS